MDLFSRMRERGVPEELVQEAERHNGHQELAKKNLKVECDSVTRQREELLDAIEDFDADTFKRGKLIKLLEKHRGKRDNKNSRP